jgi:hypothetical protein
MDTKWFLRTILAALAAWVALVFVVFIELLAMGVDWVFEPERRCATFSREDVKFYWMLMTCRADL